MVVAKNEIERETRQEGGWTRRYHDGVRDTKSLTNAWAMALVEGKVSDDLQVTLDQYRIRTQDLTPDFLAGFGMVMEDWTAALAAASTREAVLPSPPAVSEESYLRRTNVALSKELDRGVIAGRQNGINQSLEAGEALREDPTGRTYLNRRLEEELIRLQRQPHEAPHMHRQVAGMQSAINHLLTPTLPR